MIGARIRELRERLGVTQDDLATRMGVSRSAVAQWETDRASPGLVRLARLASSLGSTIEHLTSTDAITLEQVIMPFVLRDLSVLAYAQGFTMWHYKGAPSDARTPGYFSTASDMLATGDMVAVSGPAGGTVLIVTAAGSQVAVSDFAAPNEHARAA